MSSRQSRRFFSNIGESISRASSRKFGKHNRMNSELDEVKFQNKSGSLEEAEQQRILIGNLVKSGKLSVEEAMSFAEVTGLTASVKEPEDLTYNFGVYKHTKDRSRTERYILQFDFNEQAVSTIQKGKFGKKIPFGEVRDYDSEDDLRFFIYLDDGELEYDADSAEEKNKICSLLDGIVSDNKSSQYSGLNSLPRPAISHSSKRVIKEGQIEKRGHSAAFLTWSKRYLRIREGELAYYKIGEENTTALNIIKLGPGHAFIKKLEHNTFIVSTQKKEYSFRIINTNNAKDVFGISQERDEWFSALSEALQPSSPVSQDSGSPPVKSPSLQKQDLLNTALAQEEYLRNTVESLQKELEQLMSIMMVVEAPLQATAQMRKVGEIVKTLDVQIKTGLLAWTMKSVVSMSNSSPKSGEISTSFIQQKPLSSIPEQSAVMNSGVVSVRSHGDITTSVPALPAKPAAGNLPQAESKAGVGATLPTKMRPIDNTVEINATTNHLTSQDHRSQEVAKNPSIPPVPSRVFDLPAKEVQKSISPPVTPAVSSSDPVIPLPPSPGVGIPPPPPPPGVGIPPPPPFGLGTASTLPPKPLIKSSVKVRPFYWSKVPNNLLLSSMWAQAKDRVNELDLEKIEKLFHIEEKNNASDAHITKRNTSKSLLDNKRAQNLGIFLSGFKINAQDVDRRLNFIDENDGGLPLEIVISLKRFQPSTEESEMYKNYKGSKDDLPRTDHFMIKLCEIPDLSARLDLLLFILEFPLQYEELSPTVSSVLQTCTEILQNEKFQVVMEYVLAIGNYLNGGTSRGGAHGFQISSLPKLMDTRSSLRNYTLLNLLVDILSEKEPEALSIAEDLRSVKYAMEASVKGLSAEVEVLWKGLAKIKKLDTDLQQKRKTPAESDGKFHADVNKFVSEYELKLMDLNSRCDGMKESFTNLLTFLGEPSSRSSEDVFGNIHKFLTSFSAALQEKKNALERQKNSSTKHHVASPKHDRKWNKSPSRELLNARQITEEVKEKQPGPTEKPAVSTSKEPSLGRHSSSSEECTTLSSSNSFSKSPTRPTRRGTLQKLSGGKHKQPKWDVRHFELDESGNLHYFKKAEGKVINSIYLRGAPVSICEEDRREIKIKTDERTFILKAESEAEALEWKNDLEAYT